MGSSPSLSCRLTRPFAAVLGRIPGFEGTAERLRSANPDARIDARKAYETVARWTEKTGDIDLGLRAALEIEIGSSGVLDYALRTAASLRESFTLAQLYGSYFCDSFHVDWTERDGQVVVRLTNALATPRAVTDFTLGAWFRNHLRSQLEGVGAIHCYFSYATPVSTRMHRKVFAGAVLHFAAGFDGFGFESPHLDRLLPAGSPVLHSLHCGLLEATLLGPDASVATSTVVRRIITNELRGGHPTSAQVARQLKMSRRTLVRRLMLEQTNFTRIVSDVRRELALHYVRIETLPFAEIARLLGFSHTQAFHRVFRRWTGRTPSVYRKQLIEAQASKLGPNGPFTSESV